MNKLSRKIIIVTAILICCYNSYSIAGAVKTGKTVKSSLGINLAGPEDWNSELPFVDVFRLSRKWISQKKGLSWGKGPQLQLDSHGWVKKLQPGCYAEALLCWIQGNHYPSGNYTVFYDGEGELRPAFAASLVTAQPGKLTIKVNAQKGGFSLRLLATNPANPLRNIRVIMPGFSKSYMTEPFHPRFLKRWQLVNTIRFMDWMKTNNSPIRKWSERPHLSDATFTTKGIPAEVMIQLCNRLQVNPWFCMPHQATDNYIRKFAELVKAQLDPKLQVYIEYSNEVWNGQFAQCRYARQSGVKLKLGKNGKAWESGGCYYAQRSVEIFRIWENVFGGREQLVRVLAWQAAGTWWLENIILPHNNAYKHADVLAIAPYINFSIPNRRNKLSEALVAKWSMDKLFTYLEQQALPDAIKIIKKAQVIAKKFKLKLVAYEGGQHLVGIGRATNNHQLTALFHAANKDPRMGAIYKKYFVAWQSAGGGLFCYFSSISTWSKWGSWGLMQYYDDKPADNPKMQAWLNWAKKMSND